MVLSPAKTFKTIPFAYKKSTPVFMSEIIKLVKVMKTYSKSKLKSMFRVSDYIANLNFDRYQNFENSDTYTCSVLFDGPAYRGLELETLSDKDIEFAQQHLNILSGLYGVLKPLDGIVPYRLEMGQKIHSEYGSSLYEFWGEALKSHVLNQLKPNDTPNVILNLASLEYFSALRLDNGCIDNVNVHVVSVVFKDDGKVKSVYAKKARGLMCRFVIQNRIQQVQDLQKFNIDGYVYSAKDSTSDILVFHRTKAEAAKALANFRKRKR